MPPFSADVNPLARVPAPRPLALRPRAPSRRSPHSRPAPAPQASIGWWCFIDAAVWNTLDTQDKSVECGTYPDCTCACTRPLVFAMWLPGILGTLGVVMINCFNYSAYTNTGDGQAAACNNAWLFFSYLIMFGCIIASVWVMVDYWLHDQSAHSWPGIAGVIQTSCLTVSATVFFIGRESGGSRNAAGAF